VQAQVLGRKIAHYMTLGRKIAHYMTKHYFQPLD
jgi:hypothetical protein